MDGAGRGGHAGGRGGGHGQGAKGPGGEAAPGGEGMEEVHWFCLSLGLGGLRVWVLTGWCG